MLWYILLLHSISVTSHQHGRLTKYNRLIYADQMLQSQVSKMAMSARLNLSSGSSMFLPEGANCRDLSHMHVSSKPSVYIQFLYKPIDVINRPGSIAWESVLCRGTVSILNDKEGGREERHRDEGRERGRSALFFLLLYCSFPHLPTLSSVLPSVLKRVGAPQSAQIRCRSGVKDHTHLRDIFMT